MVDDASAQATTGAPQGQIGQTGLAALMRSEPREEEPEPESEECPLCSGVGEVDLPYAYQLFLKNVVVAPIVLSKLAPERVARAIDAARKRAESFVWEDGQSTYAPDIAHIGYGAGGGDDEVGAEAEAAASDAGTPQGGGS